MAQQLGRMPGSWPCTGSSVASCAPILPRPREALAGAQLNSWCSRRATSSSVSSLGSLPSLPPLLAGPPDGLGLGEGRGFAGLGVLGFDRLEGLGDSARASASRASSLTRATFAGDAGLNFS